MSNLSEETITVAQFKRRLYDLGLEIGNVAFHLGNGRDPDEAAEALDDLSERLLEEAR